MRDDRWSAVVAVGSLAFVESVKSELGRRATHRGVEQKDGAYALRERGEAYNGDFGGESEPLGLENTVFCTKILKLPKYNAARRILEHAITV